MVEHTPTPWDCVVDGTTASIGAQDGGHRIRIANICGSMSNPDIAKDTAFIVEAVNSYTATAARIAALEGALEWYAQDYNHELGCSQWDGGAKARAALASTEAMKGE